MFRWLPLVWANMKRRKLRFAFTFISIVLAFLMFGMLDALRSSLAGVVNVVGADRVLVQSKVNMTVALPRAYYEKILATPGARPSPPSAAAPVTSSDAATSAPVSRASASTNRRPSGVAATSQP